MSTFSSPLRATLASLREACRYVLQSARAESGKFIPLTTAEMAALLVAGGFSVTERDLDGLLRELVETGEVAELDYLAGYRWSGPAGNPTQPA